MLERVIVAPAVGVFRPNAVETGTVVREGDEIGMVEGLGTSRTVHSPFGGIVMGVLAHDGERLRKGQRVAWLRVA
ncbi:MAG: biotin/lipoyl-containing protein [Actinomycetota bacterium]